jgi:hypothetical protein
MMFAEMIKVEGRRYPGQGGEMPGKAMGIRAGKAGSSALGK